ncbi:CCA tRNA nucleotidyltransferase [Chloroflexota bacterium]
MAKSDNLTRKIEKQLPGELVSFIQHAGRLADSRGERLYLVGGVVRNLLLDKTNLDIDLVAEGDAIALARELSDDEAGKITIHKRFNTAKVGWHGWNIDLASARKESYARPGALPTVKPGSLSDDLFRRDFTINAIAVGLNPEGYGRLTDPYGGQKDLESRMIRFLHQKSFIDDSTRIWRGLRYEQRLDFQLEPETLRLLKRDIPMLDTISGDRIRYEIECILNEGLPEKVLHRADELGVLAKLEPSLKGNDCLAERFQQAREVSSPSHPPVGLYLALLTYPLDNKPREKLTSYLRLPRTLAKNLKDTASIKAKMSQLADSRLKPSAVYHLLEGYSTQSLTANLIAGDFPIAYQHLQLYLDRLRTVKPILTGNDLMKMGIPQGPRIKEILNQLLDARLDGKVKTRDDEEGLVKSG